MFDTYKRLTLPECAEVTPNHAHSEVDDDQSGASLQGVTEWVVAGPRALTFGWVWAFEPNTQRVIGRWSTLSTNLMVIDSNGVDLGAEATARCVTAMMSRVHWERIVAAAVGLLPEP
jgi:Domain of unknown function (DUF4902)